MGVGEVREPVSSHIGWPAKSWSPTHTTRTHLSSRVVTICKWNCWPRVFTFFDLCLCSSHVWGKNTPLILGLVIWFNVANGMTTRVMPPKACKVPMRWGLPSAPLSPSWEDLAWALVHWSQREDETQVEQSHCSSSSAQRSRVSSGWIS